MSNSTGANKEKTYTRMGSTPFEYQQPVSPDRFYGRHRHIAAIKTCIATPNGPTIDLVGLPHSGKSSLFAYLASRPSKIAPPNSHPIVVLAELTPTLAPDVIIEQLRQSIEDDVGTSPWPAHQAADASLIDERLAQLAQESLRPVVLLDTSMPHAISLEELQEWQRAWQATAAAPHCPLILARTATAESAPFASPLCLHNLSETITLGALERYEWHLLVRNGFAKGRIHVQESDLMLLDDLAGGLPMYVQLAAALLWEYQDHQQTADYFAAQTQPMMQALWETVSDDYRHALRFAAGIEQTPPDEDVQQYLHRIGMLRNDGRLWSTIFERLIHEL